MNIATALLQLGESHKGLWPQYGRALSFAFLYWVVFLLCLEPDNVRRALQAGRVLEPATELLRISVAALLGTAVTPSLLRLARRHEQGVARLQWHSAGSVLLHLCLLSGSLILAAGVLAAWIFEGRAIPQLQDLLQQAQSDGLLLVFALAGLFTLFQLRRLQSAPLPRPAAEPVPAAAQPWLTEVDVGKLGRSSALPLETVDWIETQGNYLALHTGPRTHLIRESLGRLEPRLDPLRFVRIHRRMMVALPKVQALAALGNGDAMITLADGQTLRVSRSHRRDFLARWAPPGPDRPAA